MPHREAAVVAFASGKGGTGKSFLTTSLAIALHRRGRRVVVVDCDFGLANAHLLFGVKPVYTMRNVLDGGVTTEQSLTATPHGPMLLAGGSGIASLCELDAGHMALVARSMQWLARSFDVVLIDSPAGLAPQALLMALAATHVVVVTNPEIAALTDAYALIKCLSRQPGCPELHLAVNRVLEPGLGLLTYERLAAVSKQFSGCSLHYVGEIAEDPAVTHRRLGQEPLLVSHPTCRTSLAIQRMLATMQQQMAGLEPIVCTGGGIDQRMTAQLARW
ncbi:MAG: P-loop NTPase [bacterium]|nr:P-loop NTPase [bacterium]